MADKKTAEIDHLNELQQMFRREMNMLSDNILDGSCRTLEEYRYRIGVIHGFARAERQLLDLDTEIIER